MRCRYWVWLLLVLSPYVLGAETFAPEPASGPPTLAAEYPSDGQPASAIGKVLVPGVGEVTILASRTQARLVLKAMGADGAQLGRAESVVGLGDTLIYVRSPKGLMKLVIHWKT